MASHRRTMPLLHLLVRLRWQRERDLWTVRYRDEYGRRARIFLHLSPTGISITVPALGAVHLTPWQAGQLRLALRDAVLCFGELAGPQEPGSWARAAVPEPAAPPPAGPPVRERVRFSLPPARPTVAQIAHRLATSTTPEPEDHHGREVPGPDRLHDLAAARRRQAVAGP